MRGAKRHRRQLILSPWTVVEITTEGNAVAFCREAGQSKRLLIDASSCHSPDRVSGIRARVPFPPMARHKRPNRRFNDVLRSAENVLATHSGEVSRNFWFRLAQTRLRLINWPSSGRSTAQKFREHWP